MMSIPKFFMAGACAVLAVLISGCGGDDASYVGVGTLAVSSRVQGVAYRPGQPGTYRFTIVGGAYTLGNGQWATALYVYRDRGVDTDSSQGRPHPTNPDSSVGDFEQQADRGLAEQIGMGRETTVAIGEYAVFIVPDDLGAFNDNNGVINLLIEREQ